VSALGAIRFFLIHSRHFFQAIYISYENGGSKVIREPLTDYQSTRRHIPEDFNDNLKSQINKKFLSKQRNMWVLYGWRKLFTVRYAMKFYISALLRGQVHVRSVVGKVALGQDFLRLLPFCPVDIIPPILHNHLNPLAPEFPFKF